MMASACFVQAQEELADDQRYVSARVLANGQAPVVAARSDEGWALFSYMVSIDGEIEDIVLLDSSGMPRAEQAALDSFRSVTYSPATLGGEPVASAVRQQYVLATPGMVGNPDFLTDFNAFNDALTDQEFEYADEILSRMSARRIRGNYEFALLSLGRFRLGLEQGMSINEQIRHLYRSLSFTGSPGRSHSDYFLPEDIRLGAQQSLLQLLLQANRFAEAETLYAGIKSNLSDTLTAQFDQVFERVRQIRESDQVYAVNGQLSETGAWLLPLYKRGFGITEGVDKLERAQLRCDVGSYNVTLKPDTDYQAPGSTKSCALLVQGEPGAEVAVVQF